MNYQAVIKTVPEYIIFSKRVIIPDYESLNQVVPAIGQAVAKANPGLKCVEPAYCFNVYHDGEYKEKDIDVEICQAVERFGVETEGIIFKKISEVTVVSVMHKGPYATLSAAYAFIFNWIEDNSYEVADNPRESYIDGIWNKDNPADWLTELQVPIKKH